MFINLLNLNFKNFKKYFSNFKKNIYFKHIFKLIYKNGILNLNLIKNFSKKYIKKIKFIFYFLKLNVFYYKISFDKTVKWLIKINKNNFIETVFIPQNNRGTLCISSQIGCIVNCKFCSTGKQGFNRNLKIYEIIGQIWLLIYELNKNNILYNQYNKITNLVLMGMGEPLLNYKNIFKFLNILLSNNILKFSKNNITLSTIGIPKIINYLTFNYPISLAISLHAANNNLRNYLIPLNKKYSLNSLMKSCKKYIKYSFKKSITFEYCMIKNINDSNNHANELINLLIKKLSPYTNKYKINLIPFNSFPYSKFKCSDNKRINIFASILRKKRFFVTIRKSRGKDIYASCGQLKGIIEKKFKIGV